MHGRPWSARVKYWAGHRSPLYTPFQPPSCTGPARDSSEPPWSDAKYTSVLSVSPSRSSARRTRPAGTGGRVTGGGGTGV